MRVGECNESNVVTSAVVEGSKGVQPDWVDGKECSRLGTQASQGVNIQRLIRGDAITSFLTPRATPPLYGCI